MLIVGNPWFAIAWILKCLVIKLALLQIHELQFAKDSTKTPYLKAWVR